MQRPTTAFYIDRNFWRTYWVVYELTWMGERPVVWCRSYKQAEAFKAVLEKDAKENGNVYD